MTATIRLKNTLSGEVEDFVPLRTDGKVGMYHCGPTVYDYAHVGNLRAYVFADIIRRTLEQGGFDITQVINITDFGHMTSDADEGEDKMTNALKREGKAMTLEAMHELGDFYAKAFEMELSALGIKRPQHLPRASDHVKEDVDLIQRLLDKSMVYETSDGLYFDTAAFPGYGKLGKVDVDKLKEGARVTANVEKRNPADFAVWKKNQQFGWDAPWGKGFPGWHIECSGMSMHFLGESFDIHTGGIDHIAVHHNNEIAQSEAATGKPLATYWLHCNFITVGGQKVSKSLGNTMSLNQLQEQWGIAPLAYRYWLLTSHYSSQANLTKEAVQGAATALKRLRSAVAAARTAAAHASIIHRIKNLFSPKEDYADAVLAIVGNDFDTAGLLGWLWSAKDGDPAKFVAKARAAETILALGLLDDADAPNEATSAAEIPADVADLKAKRDAARATKDWAESDRLRTLIEAKGYSVKDGPKGTELTR